jgi:peptidoglycan/LPS O-acetylase OafA/YrhL
MGNPASVWGGRAAEATLQSGDHFLPALDGWRAIAVIAVIFDHWCALSFPADVGASGWLLSLSHHVGPQAVSLFFAISGYLITQRLLIEYDRHGTISLRSFYIRRVFRILVPALLYLSVLSVIAAAGLLAVSRGEILSAAFSYSNYFPGRSFYTSHFWSLSLEEHFYLFWPALLALGGTRRAVQFGILAVAVELIWRPFALGRTHLGDFDLQRTDLRLDALLLPALLAILLHQRRWRWLADKLSHPQAFWVPTALLLATEAIAQLGHVSWIPTTFLRSALFPLIVVSTVLNSKTVMGRMLEWTPLAWIGRISYGVYLWHKLFVIHSQSVSQALWRFPLYAVFVIAFSAAVYYLFDRPMVSVGRRLAKHFVQRPAGVPVQADPIAIS